MLTRILRFALLVALSLECSVGVRAQAASGAEGPMLTPPPVSGQSYRVETEERSNYISGGVAMGAGYIDNLYPGSSRGQLGEATISLQPTIRFDAKSARQRTSAIYSPSFIFYEPTSAVNEADQYASLSFQYRFTPRLVMDVSDMLIKSSTGFGQIGAGGISGGAQVAAPGIIVPFGDRISNDATGGLSYQFSPHGMIGGSGNVGYLSYPSGSQVPGLYNTDSRGVGGFYAGRLSAAQYLGAIYQYEQSLAYPLGAQYDTQTDTISAFYTIYLTESFSLSVAGGPQYYSGIHAPFPTTRAWTPAATASMGWQNGHTSFAANFSRTVTGGGGLLGAFNTTSAAATGSWQISRLWDAGLNVRYSINKDATPLFGLNSLGGHSFDTTLTTGRALSNHSRAALSYDRIQNRFDGVQAVNNNPSSDRIMLSFTWQFERPIGR